MYDFSSGEAVRIAHPEVTNDGGANLTLSWNGPNTYSDTTQRTVDNTTVAFEQVTTPGLTNILVNTAPPALPSGQDTLGFVYNIKTTAGIDGLITVEMTYRDQDIPSGTPEADLSLYHYDADSGGWVDITTSRDPVNNVITGVTDSLSPFGMVAPLRFSDVGFRNWAHKEIQACADAGIVTGYSDGTYHPEVVVTRDQMAVFVARALAGGDGSVPPGPDTATFSDVPTNYWAFKYVEYAHLQNIVNGVGNGAYDPGAMWTAARWPPSSRARLSPRRETRAWTATPRRARPALPMCRSPSGPSSTSSTCTSTAS